MPLHFIQDDITRVDADAIVNAANNELRAGGGVCGAIFAAAGEAELTKACRVLGGCRTGEAVITPGFRLPARFIIHTAGPVWRGSGHGEADLLASCYRQSLRLASLHGLRSIAFPLISAGIFGYPADLACQVAVAAIREFLLKDDLEVFLVFLEKLAFLASRPLTGILREMLKEDSGKPLMLGEDKNYFCISHEIQASVPDLAGRLASLDIGFSQTVLRLIDEKGHNDVEIYKRANLDRRLFSKLRSDPGYRPGKATALALAVALKLDIDETCSLLSKASIALSASNAFDVIVRYFIEAGIYNIDTINETLFHFGQPLLGGCNVA